MTLRRQFRIFLHPPDQILATAEQHRLRTTLNRPDYCAGGSSALGFPGLPESLPEQAIGSGSNTLAGRARGRHSV